MDNTAVINIRTDIDIKNQAQELAKKLGFSLSSLINAYLRQLIRSKTVSFSLSENPTPFLVQSLRESKKDIKGGFLSPSFKNSDKAIKWLKNPSKKYAS